MKDLNEIVTNGVTVNDRLAELVKIYGKSPRSFALNAGIDPANLNKMLEKKQKVSDKTVKKICTVYGISSDWLQNGVGDIMADGGNVRVAPAVAPDLAKGIPYVAQVYENNGKKDKAEKEESKGSGVPFYNVDFEPGFDIMVNDQTQIPDYFINFPPYNHCTAWCMVSGNSMLPTISGGDMIAIKRIEDFRYLISGEVYALVTRNGLRTVKRVKDNGDSLTLIPDNKDYYEQTIPKSEFSHVFLVVGAAKRF